MKATALLFLLSACAPAAASLPWVTVDRSLEGAVCSRAAAEAISAKRTQERAEWSKQFIECERKRKTAEERAAAAAWWHQNGPLVAAGAAAVGIGAGIAIGVAAERENKHGR